MAKLSKRAKKIAQLIDKQKQYSADEAFTLLKSLPKLKFTQSVDVSINLGINAKKSDQMVRGASSLPNGIGKDVRVAVFTQGENAEIAKNAGADVVGMDDLAEEVKKGNFNFDVVIASPDAMGVVGRLGQILGPRGLMPNPKVGTVTTDIHATVENVKAGQVRYRNDKAGIIHCAIGNIDFEVAKLIENLNALLIDLSKKKPATAKGVYIKKVSVSSTMGPGIAIDKSSLEI